MSGSRRWLLILKIGGERGDSNVTVPITKLTPDFVANRPTVKILNERGASTIK